jgi:hypothetical protein
MKIQSLALHTPARPAPVAPAPAPDRPAGDRVELSAAPPSPTVQKLKKMGRNLVLNSLLGALPAIATSVTAAVAGPNAAGLALAGGAMASAVGFATINRDGNLFGRLGAGGLMGLISGAAGLTGYGSASFGVGPLMVGGFGAFRECLKWGVDAAENGSIEASLH